MFDFIDDISIHSILPANPNILKDKDYKEKGALVFNWFGSTFICNRKNLILDRKFANRNYIQLDESEVTEEDLLTSKNYSSNTQVVSKLDFDMFDNDYPDVFFVLPRKKYPELREAFHKYCHATVFEPANQWSEEITNSNLADINEFLDTWYSRVLAEYKGGRKNDEYLINKYMHDPVFQGNVQFYLLRDIVDNKVIGYSMISLKPSYDENSGLYAYKYLTRKCLHWQRGRRNLTPYLDWVTFNTLFQRIAVNGPMRWYDQDESYIVSSRIEVVTEGEAKKLYRKIWESERLREQETILKTKSFLINWGCGSDGDVEYQLKHWPKFDVRKKYLISFD